MSLSHTLCLSLYLFIGLCFISFHSPSILPPFLFQSHSPILLLPFLLLLPLLFLLPFPLPIALVPSYTPHPLFHQQPPPQTHSFPLLHSQSLSLNLSLPPSPTPPSGSFPPIFLFLTQTVGLPDLAWTCPCLCPLPLPNSVVHRSLYLWSGYPFSHISHSSLTQSAMIPGC